MAILAVKPDKLMHLRYYDHLSDWVLGFDVKGLFDNIPHDLILKALKHHIGCRWTILYVQEWLEAPISKDGVETARTKGTAQGWGISPGRQIFLCTTPLTAGSPINSRTINGIGMLMTALSTPNLMLKHKQFVRSSRKDLSPVALRYIHDAKSLLCDMMAIAQRHEQLGFVMDQRPENRQSGHTGVFLGVPGTNIVQGPALMAIRKSMPVPSNNS